MRTRARLVATVVVFILSFFLNVNIPAVPQQYELWNVDTRTSTSTSTSTSTVILRELRSNRNMTGSWIGHTWIPPPPWRLYSTNELKRLWANKKVWWLGDSTIRRGSLTIYHVLNNTSVNEVDLNREDIIDVNKRCIYHRRINVGRGRVVEPCPVFGDTFRAPFVCRPMPGSNNASEISFLVSWLPCAVDVQEFLRREMNLSHTPRTNILDFDVIIVSVGIWEVLKENECQINGKLDRCGRILDLLLTCLEFTHQTGVPIVWRTSGYYDYDNVDEIQQQKQDIGSMSNISMDFIDSLPHGSGLT